MRRMLAAAATTALASVLVGLAPAPAHAETYSAPLQTAISQLPVATEVRTGYDEAEVPRDWPRQRGHDALIFPTKAGTPISRNTFRTRTWLPAVKASGIDFPVRVHDLRHAHASWLLAGGADLKSVMERMGHSQIQTTQKYLHTLPTPTNAISTHSPASRHE